MKIEFSDKNSQNIFSKKKNEKTNLFENHGPDEPKNFMVSRSNSLAFFFIQSDAPQVVALRRKSTKTTRLLQTNRSFFRVLFDQFNQKGFFWLCPDLLSEAGRSQASQIAIQNLG